MIGGTRIQTYFDTPQQLDHYIVNFFTPGANGQETVITSSYTVLNTQHRLVFALLEYSSSVPSDPWVYVSSGIFDQNYVSISWASNYVNGDYFNVYYGQNYPGGTLKGVLYYPDTSAYLYGPSYANSTWRVELVKGVGGASVVSRPFNIGLGG